MSTFALGVLTGICVSVVISIVASFLFARFFDDGGEDDFRNHNDFAGDRLGDTDVHPDSLGHRDFPKERR